MKTLHPINTRVALAAFALVSSLSLPNFANAQDVQAKPGHELHKESPKKGWFWYRDPVEKKAAPEPEQPKETPQIKQPEKSEPIVVISRTKKQEDAADEVKQEITESVFIALSEEERKKVCNTPDSWVKYCGFIDPGNDFSFQAKQRDVLLEYMSISPDKPEAVEAAQYYMKWVVSKASQAANMWHFNLVQNPDLDPTVKNPISEVGIALATQVREASQYEYFKLVKDEGGVLFFFSRNDCSYCHDQAPQLVKVAETMGLQLINVPLDGSCMPGFVGDNCGDNIKPEQVAVLDVKIVPALYLFVPSNTWLRLGTGVQATSTILANTVNFFSAYRSAMLHGIDNGNGVRPSVNFNPDTRPDATGVTAADGNNDPSALDQKRIMHLLGY